MRDERIPFRRAMGGVVASAEGMVEVGDGGTREESPEATIVTYIMKRSVIGVSRRVRTM